MASETRSTAAGSLKGNCHCGAYRFQLDDVQLKKEDVVKCDCSLCRKKGCLWLSVEDGDVVVERDEGRLVKYRGDWDGEHEGNGEHEFCSICGTTVLELHSEGVLKGKKSVNVRSLRGVDVFDLDPLPQTGQSGPTTASPLRASCHCGNVVLDVLRPLAELEIKEDNCSICVRNAWLGIYPSSSQISLPQTSLTNTTTYSFGRKFNSFPFCSKCGVCVFQTLIGPPKSVVDGLSDAGKERVRSMLEIRPVNVRCLEGANGDVVGGMRNDEGTEGYERGVLGLEVEGE